jgi:Holliday junction resolvasome RuvABC endonuclease subunit
MLALDPSFTATGWVVVDLRFDKIVGAGVIRTKKAKPKERLSAAEDDARRGLEIRRGIADVIRRFKPVVIAQEGNSGSQHANSAKALARAQQACVDAVDEALEGLPIFLTQQAVKKAATGSMSASKDRVETAMRKRWGDAWLTLLAGVPKGEWENAFDAAAVVVAAWDKPAVALARKVAAAE